MDYSSYAPEILEEILFVCVSVLAAALTIGFSVTMLTLIIRYLMPKNKGAENDKRKSNKTSHSNTDTDRINTESNIQEEETIENGSVIDEIVETVVRRIE
tara:strand:+ start:292 stop:591 length:300 start_codon:yes stop_codon:yes gene_type:complete